mmetsp:Transcript_15140/g.38779  ORF Transcript_15140/g.38779 Transcript_15140/m.38779 type:complete len:99 (+) Transcript_15140:1-297(+)
MVLRTMGLLRALCVSLGVEVAMCDVFRPYAERGLGGGIGAKVQGSKLVQKAKEIAAYAAMTGRRAKKTRMNGTAESVNGHVAAGAGPSSLQNGQKAVD